MNDCDLMQLHVETLFLHDSTGNLVSVNELAGVPAPRFFLGITLDGAIWRFRYDLDDEVRRELGAIAKDEWHRDYQIEKPTPAEPYERLLAQLALTLRTWTGPVFKVPPHLPPARDTVLITDDNVSLLQPLLSGWVADVRTCQPMTAMLVDGQAVTVCCSVRQTEAAHEAGVETALSYRGRGYAARVVSAWASAVQAMGRVPFYSTSWQNTASQSVARQAGLTCFGSDLHIT